jgi:hypothetical protein
MISSPLLLEDKYAVDYLGAGVASFHLLTDFWTLYGLSTSL